METDLHHQHHHRQFTERPYRSHLQPACLPCRARKSRCKTRHTSSSSPSSSSPSSSSCEVCHVQGTACIFPPVSQRSSPKSRSATTASTAAARARRRRQSFNNANANSSAARARAGSHRTRCLSSTSPTISQRILQPYVTGDGLGHLSSNSSSSYPPLPHMQQSPVLSLPDHHPHGPMSAAVVNVINSDKGSSHVVSPAIADDDRVFHEYFSSSSYDDQSRRRMIRSHLNMGEPSQLARPILFSTVPKRGQREEESHSLAAANLEAIESMVKPYRDDLIDLYFNKVNISFPIFDEVLFRRVLVAHKDTMSPGLVSNLLAHAMIYWNTSSKMCRVPCPDHRSVWIQAEHALNTELICTPGMSTIISILLNVAGRPSSHHLGNSGIMGMAVSLANAFGLNRNPSDWNLSPSEKKFRIRIWWLVVVYDRWCSFAYGTPPLIVYAQYDVPVPAVEDLCELGRASDQQVLGASCVVALFSLTEVLGQCLEHVYHLPKGSTAGVHATSSPSVLDSLLTRWEDSLDDTLRRLVLRGTGLHGPGIANLRLSYLALKLLIQRSQLDWDRISLHIKDVDSHYYVQVRRIAEDIVEFVRELDEQNLGDFWIPQNAYSLTSATTFLMRSALSFRGEVNNPSLKLARAMIDTLEIHRERSQWDLADHCLLNCKDLMAKIESVCERCIEDAPLDFQGMTAVDLHRDIEALNELFPVLAGTSSYDDLLI